MVAHKSATSVSQTRIPFSPPRLLIPNPVRFEGLVRIFLEEGSSGMTTTTYHTGTERYLAYELVIAGEEAIPTTASDVYAVGCIGLEVCFLLEQAEETASLIEVTVHFLTGPLFHSQK
jgi:serine/threonine protein kinase